MVQVLNLFGNGTVTAVCEKYTDCDSVNVMCYRLDFIYSLHFIELIFSSLYNDGCCSSLI